MSYPRLWERLGAALVDWLIVTVFTYAFVVIVGFFAFGATGLTRVLSFVGFALAALMAVAYKVVFEAGRLQATPGKLVFGLIVVDGDGARPGWLPALIRTWPWWLLLILPVTQMLFVGYWVHGIVWLLWLVLFFTILVPPGGRCLHDQIARLFVMKAGPGLIGR